MSYKIDGPSALIAHLPAIMEGTPEEGSWVTFQINLSMHVDGWSTHSSLDEALSAARLKDESISAIVGWGGELLEPLDGKEYLAARVKTLDIIQTFEMMHGTARVTSLLCDAGDTCVTCGRIVPVDPVPGKPYAGLPLAVGDMKFDQWAGSYSRAADLCQALIEKTESDYREEVFDQEEIPLLGSLLSYRGGRDFAMNRFASARIFPLTALRIIADHGSADSLAVHSAALCISAAFVIFSPDSTIALAEWVLERDPENILAELLTHVASRIDAENLLGHWMNGIADVDPMNSYTFELPSTASIY